jgi:hypothetical protein
MNLVIGAAGLLIAIVSALFAVIAVMSMGGTEFVVEGAVGVALGALLARWAVARRQNQRS